MADIRAAASGNFSATGTWIGGVVPGSGDVAYANAFTITISDTRTVQAVSNAAAGSPVATVGGTFSLLNGCNLTCTNAVGVVQGVTATSCITTPSLGAGSSASVAANVAPLASNAPSAITFSSSGTLVVIGNIVGSNTSNSNSGITASGVGSLTVIGSVTGGNQGAVTAGITVSGAATVTITGNVTGGTTPSCPGVNITGTGNVTITGTVTGGTGAGANNASTGTLTVNGTCQSSATAPAIALGSATQITRLSGPFLLGASGNINPVQAASWRWAPTLIPTYMEVVTSGGSTKRNLYTADNMPSGGYPIAANTRSGVIYGPSSEFTGTLAVPPPSSVALGVATDNTTGTAILTAESVRTAVGLASANLDTQLDAIPTAPENAAAVRTNLTPELDRIQNCSTVDTTAQTVQNAVSS